MSEEDLNPALVDDIRLDQDEALETDAVENEIEDFEQNGLLLKIAVNGITVQDYVKKLKENDILVAVDGQLYRDGPAKLQALFSREFGDRAGWLLTFWRDGQLFDILIKEPIQSTFGLATEQETEWALEEFQKHIYGDFLSYENYEIYRDGNNVCDILSLEKDPLAAFVPLLWTLKYRLYPPLAVLIVSYAVTFFINIYLFAIMYVVLSRFFYLSQDNILRSFTLFSAKSHYMTIASTNEKDVSAIVKKIDPKNRIRFEKNYVKAPSVVHKVIISDANKN